jgi:hydrogenase nickel incorporation protein HypA/HybF
MHEMSLVLKFVEIATEYAKANDASSVKKVVLQIGELSGVVPEYLHMFYPVVVKDTLLENSELEVEMTDALVFCKKCAKSYNPTKSDGKCPQCGSDECDIIDGMGLFVKNIEIENHVTEA